MPLHVHAHVSRTSWAQIRYMRLMRWAVYQWDRCSHHVILIEVTQLPNRVASIFNAFMMYMLFSMHFVGVCPIEFYIKSAFGNRTGYIVKINDNICFSE